MSLKEMPFTKNDLEKIVLKFPTPFHIYDEKAIRENARDLLQAFEWNEGFKEYFAVKATPNPFILKVLKSEGFGTDCSSLPELLLSEKVGIVGSDIMFSSNDTPAIEF
ncbi:MAG TPA: diaminopimelate decarboxylase, partial [Syntrophus sp. (in: bacteria)]|nr:diaminopimelate decarboxylase [Syntrophus sp. (in: bacteria)]